MNKRDAATLTHVFFINADREYREGKAQNFLLPKDISRIVHAYHEQKDVEAYARRVQVSEIAAANFNIRLSKTVS